MIRGIIYKYTSPSGKVYIGQTTKASKRRRDFLDINTRYSGPKIENARHKYGPENFQYDILFEVSSNNKEEVYYLLNQKEEEYIKIFNSVDSGYNILKGGEYTHIEKHSKPVSAETKRKKSEAMKAKYANGYKVNLSESAINNIKDKLSIPILQYSTSGEFIQEWKSATEAGKMLGIKNSLITKVCKKQNKCCRNFIFFYKSDYPNVPKHIDINLGIDSNRYKDGKCRKVYQYSLDGELINIFDSVKSASEILGYSSSTLGKYCRGLNNGVYKNFKFNYNGEFS